MVKPLSDYNLIARFDMDASAAVLASGQTGTWVAFNSTGGVSLPAAGAPAFMIWNESDRKGAVGRFTPDVTASGKVTLLLGKYRASTSVFDAESGIVLNCYLSVNAKGELKKTESTETVVAICTKASYPDYFLNTSINAIDIITV